jgi:uncharacterized phage protein gp47/JayE
MPFGISDTGFELKRLQDILLSNRRYAVSIFQDLLQPNNVVDTSDSTTLGRLINLFSLPESILWEQAQLAYSSLDPNTAIGIALDNIVQYGGLTRRTPEKSNAQALFNGDIGTVIDSGSIIGSDQFKDLFEVTSPVTLSPSAASGITVSVTVENSTPYTITYDNYLGVTETITYTSDGTATDTEILNGLKNLITTTHPALVATVENGLLIVDKANYFQTSSFATSSNITIVKAKKVSILFSQEFGFIEAPANSLAVIKTPILGWDSVTNILAATEGRLTETDEELRLRFNDTKFEKSSNILDALYSALTNLLGVENVAVYENDTNFTDGNGLPPHSVSAIVLGGDDDEIARTIWENKPYGIQTFGNTTVNIIDSQGFSRPINFKRPNPVFIYVDITLTADPSFPADGIELIKGYIIDYAKENFTVGEDVVYSRLYTPINQVAGHQIDSLEIGLSPSPTGTANIPIAYDEISQFTSANISVIVS